MDHCSVHDRVGCFALLLKPREPVRRRLNDAERERGALGDVPEECGCCRCGLGDGCEEFPTRTPEFPNSLSESLSSDTPSQKPRGRQNGWRLCSCALAALGWERFGTVLFRAEDGLRTGTEASEWRWVLRARFITEIVPLRRFLVFGCDGWTSVSGVMGALAGVGGMSFRSGGLGGSRGF